MRQGYIAQIILFWQGKKFTFENSGSFSANANKSCPEYKHYASKEIPNDAQNCPLPVAILMEIFIENKF